MKCPHCKSHRVHLVLGDRFTPRRTLLWKCESCGRSSHRETRIGFTDILSQPLEDLQVRIERELSENPVLETFIEEHGPDHTDVLNDASAGQCDAVVERWETTDDARSLPEPVDLVVEKRGPGGCKVHLDSQCIPRVGISAYYRERLADAHTAAEEKSLIQQKIAAAEDFIHALKSRCETLVRVGQAIMSSQTRFLALGPECIEPITLAQVAEKANVPVTDVRRAIEYKSIETPHGVFNLRSFFVGDTNTDVGEK